MVVHVYICEVREPFYLVEVFEDGGEMCVSHQDAIKLLYTESGYSMHTRKKVTVSV